MLARATEKSALDCSLHLLASLAPVDSLDVNPLVDLAVALGDQMPRGIDKCIRSAKQEEVFLENLLGFTQLLLGLLEIKVDVQRLDEVGDRVGVLVALLAHDADEVLELALVLVRVAGAVAAGDDGGAQVAQNPRAVGLDGVDVGGGEEHVGQRLAGTVVVEQGEQRPVDQPGAVLQLRQGVVEQACVDQLLDLVDLLDGGLPVDRQDLAGQLAPGGLALLVVVGGLPWLAQQEHVLVAGATHQDAEAVQQFSRVRVGAAAVLELAELVQAVHVVEGDAVAVLQVLQVLGLVGAQVGDDVLVVQQLGDLGGRGLELVALAQDLLALGGELGGDLVEVVHVLVQLAHEVGHVGRAQQRQQQLLLLGRLLGVLVAVEIEQREQQMAVEVGHQLRQQAVLLGDGAARGRGVCHGDIG